jgi:hypothetical protein
MTLNQLFWWWQSLFIALLRAHINKSPFTTLNLLKTEFAFVRFEDLHQTVFCLFTAKAYNRVLYGGEMFTSILSKNLTPLPLETKPPDPTKVHRASVHKRSLPHYSSLILNFRGSLIFIMTNQLLALILSRVWVTIDRSWIGNWIYWHLHNVTTNNSNAVANSHPLQCTTARTMSSHSPVSSPVVAW